MTEIFKKEYNFCTKINFLLIATLPITLLVGTLISNLAVVLICIFFIIDLIKQKKNFFLKDYNFYFLFVIYTYLVLNSLFISYSDESVYKSISFIRFFILSYAIYFYFGYFKKYLIKFWFLIFLVVSIDILVEFFFGRNILGYSADYPGRIASFTGDELKIGAFYFGFLFISLSFLEGKNKNIFLFSVIISLVVALIIGERSNFLKVLSMVFLFFIFFLKISKLKKLFFFIIICLISATVIKSSVHLKGRFYNHIFDNISISKELGYVEFIKRNQYLRHYSTALMIFKEKVFFGSGFKTFRIESHKQKYKDTGIVGSANHPHQFHFEILSELGLVGYILIMLNLIYLILRQIKKPKDFLTKSGILFITASIIPILPSGSFFTSFGATIFFINYSFLMKLNTIDNRKITVIKR